MTKDEASEWLETYGDIYRAGFEYAKGYENPPHPLTVHWACWRLATALGVECPGPDDVTSRMKGFQ